MAVWKWPFPLIGYKSKFQLIKLVSFEHAFVADNTEIILSENEQQWIEIDLESAVRTQNKTHKF